MKKPFLIGGIVLLVILAGAAYYFFRPNFSFKGALPDINPVDKANPFTNIKTNPFQ